MNIQKLSDILRQKITLELVSEVSDTVLAKKYGVSRKTVWRLRQQKPADAKPKPEVITKPKPEVIAKPILGSYTSVKNTETLVFFAVQLLRRENYKDVTQAVLVAAKNANILFQHIQVLDIPVIGSTAFVRFRADIKDVVAVMKRLKDRAFIIANSTAFTLYFPDGRTGKPPASLMCAVPKLGFGQIYAGTQIKRWEYQFMN